MTNQPTSLTFEQFVRLMQKKTAPITVDEKLECVCRLDERVLEQEEIVADVQKIKQELEEKRKKN